MTLKDWPGTLFYEGVSDKQPVTVTVAPEGLRYHDTETLPYGGIQVRWNGHENNQLIVVYKDKTLYLDCSAPLLALLIQHTNGILRQDLERIQRQAQSSRKWGGWMGLVIASVLAAIVLVVGSWWAFFGVRDAVVAQIPTAWEVSWGESALQTSLKEMPLTKERALTEAVEQVSTPLLQALGKTPYRFKCYVAKSKEINAFALPGGPMVVNSALLAKVPSPEALAGVMAHEIEHVVQRHGLKRVLGNVGIGLVLPFILGDMGSIMVTLGTLGGGLTMLKFDRDQESQADREGLQLMKQAGIPPQGMVAFFQWMAQKDSKEGQSLTFLSTHPPSEERLQALQTYLGQQGSGGKQISLRLDWPKIQALAAKETPP